MHFVILSHYFAPEMGAAASRLVNTAKQIRARGHTVEVVAPMPNYPKGKVFEKYRGRYYLLDSVEGIPVHRLWLYAAQGKGARRILSYLSFAAIAAVGIFRCRRADYVFVNSGPFFVGVPGWLASVVWRSRFVINVADLWPESIFKVMRIESRVVRSVLYWYEAWLYRRAYRVTAVTLGIRRALRDEKGVPEGKIAYLPNGLDLELFSPRPRDRDLARVLGLDGKFVVLYFGSQGYFQSPGTIVKAAALLRENDQIHFLFVGGGSEHEAIVEMARGLALKNVTFLEPVAESELPRYLSLADCGVVHLINTELSRDSRPTKTLALMAMGVPVIFAGEGEGSEEVLQSESGVVVEAENPGAIADAVREMYSGGGVMLRERHGGRAYMEKHFSWPRLMDRWLREVGAG